MEQGGRETVRETEKKKKKTKTDTKNSHSSIPQLV